MKKFLFITIATSVLFTFEGKAQDDHALKSQLKGPAAKNYKVWKGTGAKETKTVLVTQPNVIKGPQAKNHRSWKVDENSNTIAVVFEEPKDIKGPNAKNQRFNALTESEYISDSVSGVFLDN